MTLERQFSRVLASNLCSFSLCTPFCLKPFFHQLLGKGRVLQQNFYREKSRGALRVKNEPIQKCGTKLLGRSAAPVSGNLFISFFRFQGFEFSIRKLIFNLSIITLIMSNNTNWKIIENLFRWISEQSWFDSKVA